jgi:hypothetical protein
MVRNVGGQRQIGEVRDGPADLGIDAIGDRVTIAPSSPAAKPPQRATR